MLKASVEVDQVVVGAIGKGLCVFLGIGHDDQQKDVAFLAKKVVRLRVFSDAAGKMSLSVRDVGGDVIVVSQFTLLGDCTKGCRPDFTQAASPQLAERMYEAFLREVEKELQKPPQSGRFREMMQVSLVNDGPVTLVIDSQVSPQQISENASPGRKATVGSERLQFDSQPLFEKGVRHELSVSSILPTSEHDDRGRLGFQ